MYTNPQSGQAGVSAPAPTLHLATYRRNILAEVIGNELFTAAEQLQTNHSVHDCQDTYRLAVWLKNVRRVAAEREQAQALAALAEKAQQEPTAAPAPATAVPEAPAVRWATSTQCDEVYRLTCLPCFTAGEKAHTLRALVTLTEQGAVKTIGSLYAAAWRRGLLPMRPESGNHGATAKPRA